MKKNIGPAAIIVFALLPFALTASPGSSESFSVLSIGRFAGLVGIILLSINFILSARYKFLEGFFNGLNRMFIIHHLVGITALVILLSHPIAIAVYYWQLSLQAAFSVIFPPLPDGFATWFGLMALLTMVGLLILTLYVKLPYHIWKATHKFMGIALFFATLHVLFINSTVTTNLPLKLYVLTFCTLGLASYVQHTVLGRLLTKKYAYKVSEVKAVDQATMITLTPVGKKIDFRLPGQFVFVKFDSATVSTEQHPFSLTSLPGDNYISIAAKPSGDYTQTLKNLKKGDSAAIEGPYGRFSFLEVLRKKQIWIAGGIGITPFVSMANYLKHKTGYAITLYYLIREPKEALFLKHLQGISQNLHNFKVSPHYSKATGHLTAEIIAKDLPDYNERDIFLCGPQVMMKNLRSQFNKLGMTNRHIHSEEFSLN